MGRTATVTEIDVINAIEHIELSGREASFTEVYRSTGGGRTEVLKLYQKVMADRHHEAMSQTALSPEVISALKKEMHAHVTKNNTAATHAFAQNVKHMDELRNILRAAENDLIAKDAELEARDQELAAVLKQAATDKLAAETALNSRDEQLRIVTGELERTRQDLNTARMEIARLYFLGDLVGDLRADLETTRAKQHEAEIRAAVAEARRGEHQGVKQKTTQGELFAGKALNRKDKPDA